MGFYSQILASKGQQELGNAALGAFLQPREEMPCESGAAFLPTCVSTGMWKGFYKFPFVPFFQHKLSCLSWCLMLLSMNENVINLLVQRHHLWPPIERILLCFLGFFSSLKITCSLSAPFGQVPQTKMFSPVLGDSDFATWRVAFPCHIPHKTDPASRDLIKGNPRGVEW